MVINLRILESVRKLLEKNPQNGQTFFKITFNKYNPTILDFQKKYNFKVEKMQRP